jgi:hypothetical protein
MSSTKNIAELSATQYKQIQKILRIPKQITLGEFVRNVDFSEFEIKGVVYILIHYKLYLDNIDPYWKQFRGVIIKDFDHIVADSHGYTPLITITRAIPKTGKITLLETRENGISVEHELDFTPGTFYLRPAFQGTMVRISLTDGEILTTTLRKGNITNSVWPNPNEKVTFAEKFELLCKYGKELFTPGKRNSPYCHIFLMCVPQVLSASHIDCGEGFVMYVDTVKCYEPNPEDEEEEQLSFLNHKISVDELSEGEKEAEIIYEKDRLFFPLSQSDDDSRPFSSFVPPPIDKEFLKQYTAVFSVDLSMTNDEANEFLAKGVSTMNRNDLRTIAKHYPLLLPGEGLYYSGFDKNGNKVNYIIVPECYNYRAALVGDPNNGLNQLIKLRQLPLDKETIDVFTNTITLDKLCFNNIAFPALVKSDKDTYFSFVTDEELTDVNFDFLHPPDNTVLIDSSKLTLDNRWEILAYFYVLANHPIRRLNAYKSFLSIYQRVIGAFEFIIDNQKDLSNVESTLYKKKALNYPKYYATSKLIRDIIETSSMKSGVSPSEKKKKDVERKTNIPKKKELTPAPSSFKKSEQSYAQIASVKSFPKETDEKKINNTIFRLLDEQDAQSLYRILALINLIINEKEEEEKTS